MDQEEVQGDTGQIDIKGIIFRYIRYWYWFVLSVVLCLLLGFLYLRYSTPLYSIKSTLLIKDDKKGPNVSGGGAVFSDMEIFKSGQNLHNEIEVLRSRGLMKRVLEELGMYTTYFSEGQVKTTELYGSSLPIKTIISKIDSSAFNKTITIHLLGGNKFDLEEVEGKRVQHMLGKEVVRPYASFTIVSSNNRTPEKKTIQIRFHDPTNLANAYNRGLMITPVNDKSSVLAISITSPIPEKGIDLVDKLVEVYNIEAVEDKNQIAANTISFIDERLKYLTTELSNVEKDVENYKRKNELTNVSSEAELYLKNASEYNKQLAEFDIKLEVLKSIENYIAKRENEFESVPSALIIDDLTLLSLTNKFNDLQAERKRLLRTMQVNNPLVVLITEQLANLRQNIIENLNNIKTSLTIARRNVQARSSEFSSRIQNVPLIERELLEINRQQGIKEGLYLYLLQKREESALSLAATVANSRVIDPATVGNEPVSPKRQLVYLICLLLGFSIPIVGIYLKELFSNRIQTYKDVEQRTKTPILGELAHDDSGQTLVIVNNSRSVISEMFRLVRTNLQFFTAGQETKTILVTSSMSQEGKTFFCANVGASLALAGKKVVILGFDLRKPRITQTLALENGVGITDFLISDKYTIDDLLQPVEGIENYYVIGSGPIPPNPAELMLLPKVDELIEVLKERFDYLIIDTAPLGQVSDALSLAKYIDATIYVVRYGFTFTEQLNIINDIYLNGKLKKPMLVLNNAKLGRGYGYGYGYSFGYNYGYDDDAKKKNWLSRFWKPKS